MEEENLSSDLQTIFDSPPPKQSEFVSERINDWIMGCDIYKSKKDCEKCYAPKYRYAAGFDYNQKCKLVSKVIANCRYYGENQTCVECEPFYLLKNNYCYLKKSQNCLKFLDENTC